MVENENKSAPKQMKYNIWNTRTKENIDLAGGKSVRRKERSNPESTEQRK